MDEDQSKNSITLNKTPAGKPTGIDFKAAYSLLFQAYIRTYRKERINGVGIKRRTGR
jgi:hypothetical protein